jgi:hypothetical protein
MLSVAIVPGVKAVLDHEEELVVAGVSLLHTPGELTLDRTHRTSTA